MFVPIVTVVPGTKNVSGGRVNVHVVVELIGAVGHEAVSPGTSIGESGLPTVIVVLPPKLVETVFGPIVLPTLTGGQVAILVLLERSHVTVPPPLLTVKIAEPE